MNEILKIFAWPLTILLLGIFFIVVFKRSIQLFINRIKSVGKGGIQTESSPEIQKEEQRKKVVQELMNLGDSIVLKAAEEAITLDLKNRGLEAEGDTVKVLIRHLAATQLALDFEQIHGLIFGSQIYLLKRLNEVVGQGKPRQYIESHFTNVQALFPTLLSWDVDQYLGFLLSRQLLTIVNKNYHITNKGVEFLLWLIRTGHREDNPL